VRLKAALTNVRLNPDATVRLKAALTNVRLKPDATVS
jgi:hypothetical protein